MKNKYLTKCLCITMAAAISFTGTASVFASEETALSETETAAREVAAEPISSEQASAETPSAPPEDNVRAGTGTSRVCTDAIRAHRNTS